MAFEKKRKQKHSERKDNLFSMVLANYIGPGRRLRLDSVCHLVQKSI